MEAQFQIRQNALEAQDYMQDLLSWQKSVKAKNSTAKPHASADQDVPAVRGRSSGSVGSAPAHMQQPALSSQPAQAAARSVSPAAHTYKNYSKWDKFDVDAALQEDEEHSIPQHQKQQACSTATKQAPPASTQQQPSSRSNNAQSTPSVAKPPQPTAAALKDRGNKLYQAGYFDDAISCYTQSLDLQPSSITFANRAMARLKLGQYTEAEQDCTAALQLDSKYVKALHRRGTARKHLGNLLDAAKDFEEGLRLEPTNKTLLADRDAALQQHLEQQKIPASNTWTRIPVQQQQQQQGSLDSKNQSQADKAAQPAAAAAGQQRVDVRAAAAEAVPATSAGSTAATTSSIGMQDPTAPAAGASSKPALKGQPPAAPAATAPARSPSPSSAQPSPTAAAEAAAAQLAARLAAGLKAPRSSAEFEAAWRSFKGDAALQAKYLKLVPPQQLPSVLKTSLTAELLTAVLTVSLTAAAKQASNDDGNCDALDAAHAVALVEHMVHVPRFDMTVMCLTKRDKGALGQLFDAALEVCSTELKSRLDFVRSKYRL